MKGQVIGGYEFKNKKGNEMASICLKNIDNPNVQGVSANSYLAMRSNMPSGLKDMIGKTFICDKDNIGFLCDFYEVK